MIKPFYDKPRVTLILSGKKSLVFTVGISEECELTLLIFNILWQDLETLARLIKEKEIMT